MSRPAESFRVLKCVAFLCLYGSAFLGEIFAAASSTTGFMARGWNTDDGLPHSSAQVIAQTQNGYLWIGTKEGLSRFDGLRFESFDDKGWPGLGGQSFTAICETSSGDFWFGTENWGLGKIRHGKIFHYAQTNGFIDGAVRAICESGDGTIWIGSNEGLIRQRDGKFQRFTENDGLADNMVRSFYPEKDGTLWIATGSGLSRWKAESLSTVALHNGQAFNSVRALCRDKEGSLWIGTHGGLTRWRADEWMHFTKADGLADNIVSAIHEDRRGNLWVGTYGGLHRIVNGRLVEERNHEGASFDLVYSICEDHEGSIWIGTKSGLCRLNPRLFSIYSIADGLPHHTVTAVCEDRAGGLWVATWGGGLCKVQSDSNGLTAKVFNSTNGLGTDYVLALHEGRDGNMWIGTAYDSYVLKQLRGDRFTRFGKNEGLKDETVTVVFEDSHGNVWIGARGGLNCFRDGEFSRFTATDGLAGNTVKAICEDAEGQVWFGTDQGLSRWKDGRFESFGAELGDNAVTSLLFDREHRLWIAREGGGLNRYGGGRAFVAYRANGKPFPDDITEIIDDQKGFLWLASRKGIIRADRKQLDDYAAGISTNLSSVSYGKAEGLLHSECSSMAKPGAWRRKNGELAFATAKGVATIHPGENVEPNSIPPPVVIEKIIADKNTLGELVIQKISEEKTNSFTDPLIHPLSIPPGRGELEIHYAALSLRAPEKNRYKYKLQGIDSDWVDAGTRRAAYYNNLPPGRCEFRVIACNGDNVWNTVGSRVQISLLPHFWQTTWFTASIGLILVGSVVFVARSVFLRKMQRKLDLLERQNAIANERTRIAQDMHDELGARLTEILLLTGVAKKNKTDATQVEAQIDKISVSAKEVIDNLHAIVWTVNPRNDFLDNFANYLQEYVPSFLKPAGIRCRFDTPARLPALPLSSEIRHNLLLVVKEAVNNAAKHSGASEVCLRLRLEQSILQLVIEDNGKGMSNASAVGLGNGLRNMRKRIEKMDGQFNLQSEVGKGTRIQLSVPIKEVCEA